RIRVPGPPVTWDLREKVAWWRSAPRTLQPGRITTMPQDARLTEAAYQGAALTVDEDFYGRIGAATERRRVVDEFTVPIRSGRAWEIPAGRVCRISTPEGPQVGDLNLWNRHDPRERFWAARTRQLQAAHLSTFDRLWSTLPFLRPMA